MMLNCLICGHEPMFTHHTYMGRQTDAIRCMSCGYELEDDWGVALPKWNSLQAKVNIPYIQDLIRTEQECREIERHRFALYVSSDGCQAERTKNAIESDKREATRVKMRLKEASIAKKIMKDMVERPNEFSFEAMLRRKTGGIQ